MKPMRKLFIVLLAMLVLATPLSCQAELNVSLPMESDKKKKVKTLFGAVRDFVFRRFYYTTSWGAVIIKLLLQPEKFWINTNEKKCKQMAEVRKDNGFFKNRKIMQNKRLADQRGTLWDWAKHWGANTKSMWYSMNNLLYFPARLHFLHKLLQEKRIINTKLQSFFVLTLGLTWLHATDYYFDAVNGNDANNGLTWGTAKRTVYSSGGFCSISLNPGDNAYFGAGQDFTAGQNGTQFFYTSRHGTAINPITITKYGVGDNPILPSVMCTSASGGYYWHFINVDIVPYQVHANADCFFMDYAGRATGCYFEGVNFWAGNAVGAVVDCACWSLESSDTEVYNCYVFTDNAGVSYEAGSGGLGSNNICWETEIEADDGGAQDGYGPHSDGGVYRLGGGYYCFDVYIHGPFGENCIDMNGSAGPNRIYHCVGVDAAESIIVIGYWCDDLHVFQNYMATDGMMVLNPCVGGSSASSRISFYNNIMEMLSQSSRGVLCASTVYTTYNYMEYMDFMYNTVLTMSTLDRGVIYFVGDTNRWGTSVDTFRILNNIFVTKEAAGSLVYHRAGTYAPLFDRTLFLIDYNCYYKGSTAFAATGGYTWETWQSTLGNDTHGLNEDPKVADATYVPSDFADIDYTNYWIASDSPCIDAALAVSSGTFYYYDAFETNKIHTMTGITVDFNSGVRATDIGAFEYDSPPPEYYTISGNIAVGVTPLQGVTVSDGTRTDITDASGDFTLSDVPNGSYDVTPSLPGYIFDPVSDYVVVASANVTGVDFTGEIQELKVILDGETRSIHNDEEIEVDLTQIKDGGIQRTVADVPSGVVITGNIEVLSGGTLGHIGGVSGGITLNGLSYGAGDIIGEFERMGTDLYIVELGNLSELGFATYSGGDPLPIDLVAGDTLIFDANTPEGTLTIDEDTPAIGIDASVANNVILASDGVHYLVIGVNSDFRGFASTTGIMVKVQELGGGEPQ